MSQPMDARFASDDLAPGDLEFVTERLEGVRGRVVSAGGDPDSVRIVAVTKGFGLAAVRAAIALGLDHVGENYADELVAKAGLLAGEESAAQLRWHFLGAVQRNKLTRLAPVVARYEGVDRLVEGERIARLAPGASVLVEVDLTGASGRGGAAKDEVPALVTALQRLELSVDGLMTVAPPGPPALARSAFAEVASLAAELGLAERSMGMSGDLEEAVAAGSTTLRLGAALFGPRPGRPEVSQ